MHVFAILDPSPHLTPSILGDGHFHITERHPKQPQQLAPFLIRLGTCHNCDLHPADLVDLIVLDLREENLLPQPQSVVAPAIKSSSRYPPEVTSTWQCNIRQPIQEGPHVLAAQSHLDTNRAPFAQFEVRDA